MRGDNKFVVDLIADLGRGGYRTAAWRGFLSTATRRARSGIGESRSRLITFLAWVALALAGMMALGLLDLARVNSIFATVAVIFWFAVSTLWTLMHLSMARSGDGVIQEYFYPPNGLSYLRLATGPAMVPVLASFREPMSSGWGTVILIAALAMTDMLDGLIARSTGKTSYLGRVLDPLADIVFLFSLTLGLTIAGVLPLSLLVLMFFRYPYLLLAVVVYSLMRKPMEIRPTIIGKVTSATTSAVLTAVALAVLVDPDWLMDKWVDWAVLFLHVPIVVNLAYLLWKAISMARKSSPVGPRES